MKTKDEMTESRPQHTPSIIRVREQAGTDAVRKFDYQMAVALDYLISEMDNDVLILIETLEDFAIFRNHGRENETVDIFQVKTKDRGLYDKGALYSDNVLGKIILTDYYFDSKARTLNIVCNTPLKGSSTEALDEFVMENTLTPKELEVLKANVSEYLEKNTDFSGSTDPYIGKLIYVKSSLPFSRFEERYSETLVGKTNNAISHHLNDENHSINPQIVFNTLRLLIDRQRRNRITQPEIGVEDALVLKGIPSSSVKSVIDQAAESNHLSKNEILQHAAAIFSPTEYRAIKDEYPVFLACQANLSDLAYQEAKETLQTEYYSLTNEYDSLDEIIRHMAYNCSRKIPYYSLALIQILSIVVVYS